MTEQELKNVLNFKIYNENGSIEFFGTTDLAGVDLGNDVQINKSSVIVYGEDENENKPLPGNKLNKPALIKLYSIEPKSGQTE